MVNYDPKILQKYAESLYRDAAFVVFVVTTFLAIIGLCFGLGVGSVIVQTHVAPESRTMGVGLVGIAAAVIFGVVGYFIGQAIAFWYRLKAQQILCQKQIELNTRVAVQIRQSASFDEIIP